MKNPEEKSRLFQKIPNLAATTKKVRQRAAAMHFTKAILRRTISGFSCKAK